MTPDKQTRHEIYLRMRVESKEDVTIPYGMCHWLCDANWKLFGYDREYEIEEMPELIKHKPEHIKGFRYWFDLYDKQIRLDILDQAIEETK